jgi:hypothetical protein
MRLSRLIVGCAFMVATTLALGQATQSTPWNPSDNDFKQMLGIWTKMVDDLFAAAVSRGRILEKKADPDTEIAPFLEVLARNPYFDVEHEVKIHPSHRKYILRIATLKGIALKSASPSGKKVLRYPEVGPSFAITVPDD